MRPSAHTSGHCRSMSSPVTAHLSPFYPTVFLQWACESSPTPPLPAQLMGC